MHDLLRDMFLEHAPRKVLRAILVGSSLLMLVGIAGPQRWVTHELVCAAMDRAATAERAALAAALHAWLGQIEPDIPANHACGKPNPGGQHRPYPDGL